MNYTQVGAELGRYVRSTKPNPRQIQALLRDLLAGDELLLPMQDVALRYSVFTRQNFDHSDSILIERDDLLQELSSRYIPQVVDQIKELLNGMISVTLDNVANQHYYTKNKLFSKRISPASFVGVDQEPFKMDLLNNTIICSSQPPKCYAQLNEREIQHNLSRLRMKLRNETYLKPADYFDIKLLCKQITLYFSASMFLLFVFFKLFGGLKLVLNKELIYVISSCPIILISDNWEDDKLCALGAIRDGQFELGRQIVTDLMTRYSFSGYGLQELLSARAEAFSGLGDLGAACNDYKYLVDLQIDQLNKLKITGKTIPPTYNDFLKTISIKYKQKCN